MRNTIKTLLAAALLTGTAAFAHADDAAASTSAQQQTIVQYTDTFKEGDVGQLLQQIMNVERLYQELQKNNPMAISEVKSNAETWKRFTDPSNYGRLQQIRVRNRDEYGLIIKLLDQVKIIIK